MKKARTIAITKSEYIRLSAIHFGNEILEMLYGDEQKTRRTLGLCMLAMAAAFLLSNKAPLVCGV
jgi:hypothetical protein